MVLWCFVVFSTHFCGHFVAFCGAYLFIAVAVTSLFSRYLLIVVLVIYSLLKMVAEKGACRKRKWSKTGSLYLLLSKCLPIIEYFTTGFGRKFTELRLSPVDVLT